MNLGITPFCLIVVRFLVHNYPYDKHNNYNN